MCICTHMNTHFTRFNHTANAQKQAQNRLPVYHIHLTLLLSSSLPDTNPGQKIPFKSTVCRLCFTGGLCYCVITHKHSLPPSLFPSLSPATPPPPSLPRSSAVGAEPLIKSLRQKLLSSEYQVSAFRQEQH